jgi:PAS domain S-box-containing protein
MHIEKSSAAETALADDFLSGGGRMGAMMRAFDFSGTPLGPVVDWPASLRAATSICLNSRYPMFIAWGTHQSMIYNDAYTAVLAGKHPGALGRPAQEVWAEIWHILGPHWTRVFDQGEATWAEDLLLVMNRSGYAEETYFTFSYSPIRGEGGSVGGMFCACQETTEKVVGERRLKTLRELAAQATLAKGPQEAIEMAMKTFSANPEDLPFALLYVVAADGGSARLAGSSGLDMRDCCSPGVSLEGATKGSWPLGAVVQNAGIELVDNLNAYLDPVPSGCWEKPATRAILLPLKFSTLEKPSGVLVCGVSPVREVDEGYRTFFEVAAGQTASAIANAQAYQQERQRAEALVEIDRAKTVFFSNVSHEFRTPLTLMLGPVEDLLATSHTGLSPAAKGQLEIVNRNGFRLLRLVNTLLDFSRIEAGRVQAVFEPTDLASFTMDLASVFRAATERAGLKLAVDCPQLPEPVYVDRDMWEKVVLNLVSNAFKFTLEGEIEVSLRAADGNAVLRVRDTGVGIPAEEMPRIFERFHRIPNVRSRTHEGSGIGLALVQELIKLHGGTIRAESRLNQGTTFIATLPLGKDHLPADRLGASRNLASTAVGAAPFVEEALRWLPEQVPAGEEIEPFIRNELIAVPSFPPEADDNRPRVIVADDNADMRQYLSRMLMERYNVQVVADGEAALQAARAKRPDLILSDIMMPCLDGLGLVQEIRADAALKTVPVILLSARAGEESRIEGLQHGADDYLIKPFSARELQASVAAHLKMARARREADQALRESENLLSEAQRIAGVGSWRWNIQTGEVQWSDQLYAIFGVDPKAFTPSVQAFSEYIHPNDRQVFEEKIAQISSSGTPVDFEFRIVSETGSTRVLRSVGQVTAFDSTGNPLIVVGASMDITERKHEEQQLRRLNQNLEHMVAERTKLAEDRAKQLQVLAVELIETEERERRRFAELLHDDLQQMLASARFQLHAVGGDASADPALVTIGRILEESIAKSRRLTHELSPPVMHYGSLHSAIEWLAGQMMAQFGLDVHLEAENIPELKTSPLKVFIFRAVQELLFNIIKHAGVKSARVVLSGRNSHLEVTVSDQGNGFDKTALDRSRTQKGFGLISIRERARYIGGDLKIDSEPGRGSRFYLSVPVQPAIEDNVQVPLEAPFDAIARKTHYKGGGLRVLFADDHQVMRQGLIRLISSQPDIQVAGEAANGREAVELARQLRPDVIVMDISMPVMDGIEATRRIKSELPEVRIIGLSMFEDDNAAQNFINAGAHTFVRKTASSAELLKAIYGSGDAAGDLITRV